MAQDVKVFDFLLIGPVCLSLMAWPFLWDLGTFLMMALFIPVDVSFSLALLARLVVATNTIWLTLGQFSLLNIVCLWDVLFLPQYDPVIILATFVCAA